MRSHTIAKKLFDWRIASVALALAGLAACGSTPHRRSGQKSARRRASRVDASRGQSARRGATQKRTSSTRSKRRSCSRARGKGAHTCVDVVEDDQPHGEGSGHGHLCRLGQEHQGDDAPPFDGTPIGQCATRAFINIIVSPFEGPDVDMPYPVNLKPDAKSGKKDAAKPKK